MIRRRRQVPARSPAAEDARALALEVSGLRPARTLDPASLGLVVGPGEKAYRAMELWLSQLVAGRWPPPTTRSVILTDARLIVRMPLGQLESLWWRSLVGFQPDLDRCSLILDYGDGCPRSLSGPDIPAVTVIGITTLYGVEALATHAALAGLRGAVPG